MYDIANNRTSLFGHDNKALSSCMWLSVFADHCCDTIVLGDKRVDDSFASVEACTTSVLAGLECKTSVHCETCLIHEIAYVRRLGCVHDDQASNSCIWQVLFADHYCGSSGSGGKDVVSSSTNAEACKNAVAADPDCSDVMWTNGDSICACIKVGYSCNQLPSSVGNTVYECEQAPLFANLLLFSKFVWTWRL